MCDPTNNCAVPTKAIDIYIQHSFQAHEDHLLEQLNTAVKSKIVQFTYLIFKSLLLLNFSVQ